MKAKTIIIMVIFSMLSIAWINPKADKIKAGNHLYKQGKYDEAMGDYNDVLIDLPNSPYIHYNIGNAAYKKGDYEKAIEAYTKSLATDNPEIEEKANYNIGNAKYKQGKLKENTDLSETIKLYRESLDYYKRAIDLNPKNVDAKFNHEFVERKIKELLDRQKQEPKNKQDKKQQNKQEQGKNRQDKKQQKQNPKEEQQKQEEQAAREEQNKAEQKQSGQESGEKKQMTKAEAMRLLDALKDEEQPQLLKGQRQMGHFPEVFKDW